MNYPALAFWIVHNNWEDSDGTSILFWRKSLLDEAGLDFSEITHWNEFITAGKKLTLDRNTDGVPDQWAFTHVVNMYNILLNGGKGGWFSGGQPYEPPGK